MLSRWRARRLYPAPEHRAAQG